MPVLAWTALRRSTLVAALGLLAAIALVPQTADAQIYKWKDASGRWQFSDRPPPDAGAAERMGDDRAGAGSAVSTDLAAELEAAIGPRSPVERASISVVHVKTPLGQGSGFFVTDDGYLLTNQHVVRPKSTRQWEHTEESIERARDEIERAKKEFDREKKNLDAAASRLEAYRDSIPAEKSGSRRRAMREQYEAYRKQYDARRRQYREARREFDAQRRRFEKERLELSRRSSAATLATNFQITLKDGRKLTARLVGLGGEQDLALLKVDGYRTPHIERTSPRALVQGSTVYAIGSPLGVRDSVSRGVVAGLKREVVLTDAKILPGNSGGPLISDEGQVVGVNTAKIAESASAEGIGVAIRIDVAFDRFPELGR